MRQCTNEKEGDYGYGIADDRGNACSASERMFVDSSSQESACLACSVFACNSSFLRSMDVLISP